MSEQGGGTIINIGSVAGVRAFRSSRSIPRRSTRSRGSPRGCGWSSGRRAAISTSRISRRPRSTPRSSNRPGPSSARRSCPPPPIYDPRIVAESIVFAAEHPRRDIFVGGAAKMFDVMERISPAFTDWLLTRNDKIFRDRLRHAARRPRQPLRAASAPPDDPGRLRRPGPSHELVDEDFEWHPVLKPVAVGALAFGRRGPVDRAERRDAARSAGRPTRSRENRAGILKRGPNHVSDRRVLRADRPRLVRGERGAHSLEHQSHSAARDGQAAPWPATAGTSAGSPRGTATARRRA